MSKGANKSGKVYLVGAGQVISVWSRCVQRSASKNADVIVYDHLANPDMLGWRATTHDHLC